jgi:nicotinamidase-related amidase
MRHRQILDRNKVLLLIIDFQQKLLAAFSNPDEILRNCMTLIKFAKILNLPIIWTEQYPKGLGKTVDPLKSELSHLQSIEKQSFSCFGEPKFLRALSRHGRQQLLVCGIETHICVEQTVLDGIESGYQAHVVTDACGSRRMHDHSIGLDKMKAAGASLTCAETTIYEILERSDTSEFREVLRLVK